MNFPAILFADYASGRMSRAAFVSRFSSWQRGRKSKPLRGFATREGVFVKNSLGFAAMLLEGGERVLFRGKPMGASDFLSMATAKEA